MLLVSSFYTFSEILSSNVTAGIPVLPWWTGKFGTIIVCTINTKKKRLYMINAKVNISFNLFFFPSNESSSFNPLTVSRLELKLSLKTLPMLFSTG